jgi:hypothetical protein
MIFAEYTSHVPRSNEKLLTNVLEGRGVAFSVVVAETDSAVGAGDIAIGLQETKGSLSSSRARWPVGYCRLNRRLYWA